MKPLIPFILCLLITLALTGCSKEAPRVGGGVAPGRGQTPAAVSSSAQVVKVTSSPVTISQDGPVDAVVTLSISPGFHVNANPATFPYLIATELTADKVDGVTAGTPVYPAAEKKKFQFAEQPLAVYEGETPIKLNLRTETNVAAGSRSLPVNVRVQACDEEQCFPPATIKTTISVTVK
jgi:thiol:disulfide interchange protein DsbD